MRKNFCLPFFVPFFLFFRFLTFYDVRSMHMNSHKCETLVTTMRSILIFLTISLNTRQRHVHSYRHAREKACHNDDDEVLFGY